jgi:hypothetical protein
VEIKLADDVPHPMPLNLGDEAVRRRPGPTALKAFRRIMDIWQTPANDARRRLGLAQETDLDIVDPERLSEEQMLRISCLIGTYKALHICFGEELSDEWVRLPNTGAMFAGRSPIAYMAEGGFDALRQVRRLVDARSVGN